MARMRVVTTRDRADAALKMLHEEGVLHVEQSEELEPVEREVIDGARNRVSDALRYLNEILSYIPEKEKVFLKEDLTTKYLRPFDEIENDARSLYTTLTSLYKKAAGLEGKIKRLREDNRYLRPLAGEIDLKLSDLSFSGNYLFARVFVISFELHQSFLDRIQPYTLHTVVATYENEAVVYVIARVEGKKHIEAVANDLGCRTLEVALEDLTLKHFLGVVVDRIQELEGELTAVTQDLQSRTREHVTEIVLLKEALSAENERLAILEKASEARYVSMIEGWIPEAKVEPAIRHLKEKLDIIFVDARAADESEEPPTKLNNLRPLRPFEMVVGLFGTPGYREWDPTPVIAYSFAVFFGLMLNDMIYALGLMLAAKFVLPSFTDDPESANFKLFQRLIYTSSVVAFFIGLLSGTALGDFSYQNPIFRIRGEDWALVEVIAETLMDPISFIIVALVIGIIHINVGHLLGLIKGVKERNKGVVLSRAGIFVLQIFGIPFFLYAMMDFDIVPMEPAIIFGYLAALGFVMIVVAAFVQMKGLGAIFWLLDVTGILGDIMSYARLAGVGLATLYLASAFNMMAYMIFGGLSGMLPGLLGIAIGGITAIIILTVGHLLNLALSGLAAFIHSLRLCFVEFLFKFYEGGGRQYEPFCLKPRTFIVVG
jgi:V/A-type H+-transporting ATPase subunit I